MGSAKAIKDPETIKRAMTTNILMPDNQLYLMNPFISKTKIMILKQLINDLVTLAII